MCKKNCCELCFELEFSAILNNFTRGHQHTAPTVTDQCWRPSNELCIWRVVDAETGAAAGEGLAWYVASRTLIQLVSQDIRSDWWFVMVAGSVSISFAYNPPPPLPPSPNCFAAALQGNQDSDTSGERGWQWDLRTKPGTGINLVCLKSFKLECACAKVKRSQVSVSLACIYLFIFNSLALDVCDGYTVFWIC